MLEPKSITVEARKDMQVSMEDFLSGGYTVGKEEIDPLATNSTAPNGRSQALAHDKHAGPDVSFDIRQINGMRIGHNQQVPRIDGLNVHECANVLIPIDDVRWLSAGDNLAEDAGVGIVRHVA